VPTSPREALYANLFCQNPTLMEGPLCPLGPMRTLSFVVSRLERLPSSDGVAPELLRLVEPLIFYLFVQLNLAANANESSRVRQKSLRKLEVALRSLRPAGRPGRSLYFEVSDDWPSIERLRQQFLKLMSVFYDHHDLDENSAQETVRWVRRALDGDPEALECIRTHSPGFLENPLNFNDHQRAAFLSLLAKIRRPRGPLSTFATCAVSAKYGLRRRAAQRLVQEIIHVGPCPF